MNKIVVICNPNTNMSKSTFSLRCLQFNATSILRNLNEFRTLMAKIAPDIVCIQEDGIVASHTPDKINQYVWLHSARTQPRSPSGHLRGGGVSILVRSDLPNLHWQELPPISLAPDLTTELIRARLFWIYLGRCLIIDVVNVYLPPISSLPSDIRQDRFDITRITPLLTDNCHLCSPSSPVFLPSIYREVGVLLCGDFNAHHPSWDKYSKADSKGRQIFKFATLNNLDIANNGQPTCYLPSKHSTAVDLTISHGCFVVTDWKASHLSLGKSPHRILSYTLAPLAAFYPERCTWS
jgi:hypothetical protein